MADVSTSATTVDATRMQFIAEIVQRELAAKAKMRGLISDVSEFAEPGRKSIDFPKLGSFSVTKRADGVKADATALAYSSDQLALDQNATVQYILEKKATIQSRLKLEAANAQRAASAHSRGVDIDVLEAMALGAAVGNNVLYNALDIRDNILEVVQNLDEADAPEESRFLVFRPAQKKLMLAVDNFVSAEKYGDRTPIVTGEIGMVYGLRLVMSNTATTTFIDGVMLGFQSEAMALGFQIDPMIDEQKAIEYGAGAKRVAVDQLYGLKVLQSGNLISKIA